MTQSTNDLLQLGDKAFKRADYQRAIGWFEQATSQAQREGEINYELYALSWITVSWGNLANHQKEIETATRLLARARIVSNELFQMKAALRLCEALASIDLRRRWPEIRPLLQEGLAMARRLNSNFDEIYHLMLLGDYAVRMGELEAGYNWLQEALHTIGQDTDKVDYFRKEIYSSLSNLMRRREEVAEAVRYGQMSIGAAERGGNPSFVAHAQLTLAKAEQAAGELGTALSLVETVLPQSTEQGWQGEEQIAHYLRAELERQLGHPETAIDSARRALALAQSLQLKEDEVEAYLSLGEALLALGQKETAVEALRRARRLSQERDYADHFAKAEELLAE